MSILSKLNVLGRLNSLENRVENIESKLMNYNIRLQEVEMPTPNELNFLENILKRQRLAYFNGSKASRKDVRAFLDIWGPVARGTRTAEQAFRLQNN